MASRHPILRLLPPAATALLLAGCLARSEPPPAPEYHHLVESLTLDASDGYRVWRAFSGVVGARQSADLGFELAGTLTRVAVEEGDRVRQGQALASLDTALLESQRDELQAQVREAEAQLQLVRQNLRRIRDLNRKGYASAQQQDELETQRAALQATLARLAAALQANATRLGKARLTAPFDGTVSRRYLDTGAVAAAGAPVLRVLQSGPLEARIGVPPRLLADLSPGATVTLKAAGRDLEGRVLAVNPDLDPATRTVPVRVALGAGQLVDGDLVELYLPESVAQAGFWVPLDAVTAGPRGLWRVYVLDPAPRPDRFRLEPRDVRIEHTDGRRAFVAGALADGEAIAATGLHRLAPGQLVRRRSGEG